MNKLKRNGMGLAAGLLASTSVSAHTGIGTVAGFSAGLMHPLLGLDHLLVMVATGLWAVYLGGRAIVLLPLAFIALMTAGATLGFMGYVLPYAEWIIALSVLTLGLALWRGWQSPSLLAGGLTAFFALFHGYVHAAEIGEVSEAAYTYALGFLLTTALLHGVGMGLGLISGASGWKRKAYGLFCTGAGLYWLLQGI